MKIYLAGPMRGYPQFNFPAFHAAAEKLRAKGHYVFSPAEKDNERYGEDISKNNHTGSEEQAFKEYGITMRECLAADLKFICEEAEAIYLLPGWQGSRGARAERATAEALDLKIFEL